MFRVRFADGGELQLTEAGSKKRAGVWLLRPDALCRRARAPRPRGRRAHDGGRRAHSRLRLAAPALAAARPAPDRGHRPRVGERDPLVGAALAVPALDAGRRRADRTAGNGDPRRAGARARAAARRGERRQGLPRAQPPRRAVRTLRHPACPRRLRGAHDLLLPAVPDRRPDAEGPAALPAAEVSALPKVVLWPG